MKMTPDRPVKPSPAEQTALELLDMLRAVKHVGERAAEILSSCDETVLMRNVREGKKSKKKKAPK